MSFAGSLNSPTTLGIAATADKEALVAAVQETLEDILANDFILKLPPDYCNSCLLTVCVRCNVRLTNNVNTDETMRSALREEIRERQGGWGKLIDWFANHNYRWVFNAEELKKGSVAWKYMIVWTGSIVLNTLGTYALTEMSSQYFMFAKVVVAVIVAIFWNYQLQRLFV